MTEIQLFLSHAIQLEREAAARYVELAAAMENLGNHEVASFFAKMAIYARRHLDEAVERGGLHEIPAMDRNAFRWPGGESPEAPELDDIHPLMDVQSALLLALEGEHRSQRFYSQVCSLTQDDTVRVVAAEFSIEEAEHVALLQNWLQRSSVAS
ncbi:ferritin family protein [Uliginosibacterium sediminicola]|uniref:Ferritin family protein n=1 Tax=Uliginosibacterium sediminicola TaxID=2024550 RepID=A0ABU9Z233_9RHOO